MHKQYKPSQSIFVPHKKIQTVLPREREELCFDQANMPENPTIIRANMGTGNNDFKVLKPIYVHSIASKIITPASIIDDVNILSSSSIASCSFDDTVYLALFNEAIDEFVYMTGEDKINTFLVQIPIVLDRHKDWYELPGDFHTQSNLFIKKDCCLYTRFQRFNFQSFETWSENNSYYTYSINNNRLYIKIPNRDLYEACDSCIAPDGSSLTFEYYMTPSQITSLNEPLMWFPPNRAARRLMVEIMKELLANKDGSIYVSPNKAKWFTAMMENTNGINKVDSNKQLGRNVIKISKF